MNLGKDATVAFEMEAFEKRGWQAFFSSYLAEMLQGFPPWTVTLGCSSFGFFTQPYSSSNSLYPGISESLDLGGATFPFAPPEPFRDQA